MSRAMEMPPFVNLDTSKHDMSNNELDNKTFTKVDNFDFIDYNNEDVINELYLGDRYSEKCWDKQISIFRCCFKR